jgi:replication factor A1
MAEKKIAEFGDREEVTVEVTVTKITPTRQFKKKDGSEGKVRNIDVKDETGSCRVALWDADVDMIESQEITEGTVLKCTNCFVKLTNYGVDISKGRNGSIEKKTNGQ